MIWRGAESSSTSETNSGIAQKWSRRVVSILKVCLKGQKWVDAPSIKAGYGVIRLSKLVNILVPHPLCSPVSDCRLNLYWLMKNSGQR